MAVRTTLVTTLPRLAHDFAWSAAVVDGTASTTAASPQRAPQCRVEYVRVDLARLTGELEAELRRMLAPGLKPKRS